MSNCIILIGAGASKPYGYPTQKNIVQLMRDHILQANQYKAMFLSSKDPKYELIVEQLSPDKQDNDSMRKTISKQIKSQSDKSLLVPIHMEAPMLVDIAHMLNNLEHGRFSTIDQAIYHYSLLTQEMRPFKPSTLLEKFMNVRDNQLTERQIFLDFVWDIYQPALLSQSTFKHQISPAARTTIDKLQNSYGYHWHHLVRTYNADRLIQQSAVIDFNYDRLMLRAIKHQKIFGNQRYRELLLEIIIDDDVARLTFPCNPAEFEKVTLEISQPLDQWINGFHNIFHPHGLFSYNHQPARGAAYYHDEYHSEHLPVTCYDNRDEQYNNINSYIATMSPQPSILIVIGKSISSLAHNIEGIDILANTAGNIKKVYCTCYEKDSKIKRDEYLDFYQQRFGLQPHDIRMVKECYELWDKLAEDGILDIR